MDLFRSCFKTRAGCTRGPYTYVLAVFSAAQSHGARGLTSVGGQRSEVVDSVGRPDVVACGDLEPVLGGRFQTLDGVHAFHWHHRLAAAQLPLAGRPGRRPLDRVVQYVAAAIAPQVEPYAGRRTVVRDGFGRRRGRHGHCGPTARYACVRDALGTGRRDRVEKETSGQLVCLERLFLKNNGTHPICVAYTAGWRAEG